MDGLMGFSLGVLVFGTLAAALLAAVRIVRGPLHADRVVALDILLAAAVALCIAAALGTGRTVFLDVAIGLALVGFVATIGWSRLIDRSTPMSDADDPQAQEPRR